MSTPILRQSDFLRGFRRFYFYWRSYSHRKREKERRLQMEESIEEFKRLYEEADKNNIEENKEVFNIGLYYLFLEYDISALGFQMFSEIDEYPKKVLARQFAILMYEASQDFPKLLGKSFRKIVSEQSDAKYLLEELNLITKDFNEFKKVHVSYLNEVRNYCGAHRDNEAYKQLIYIEELDVNEMHQIGANFMIPVKKIPSFMTKLMKVMTEKRNNQLQ